MRRSISLLIVLGLFLTAVPGVAAQIPTITVRNDQATLDFPNQVVFSASFQSDVVIQKVVLEYGVKQLTCGQVVAKAFPDIKPGKSASADWTWEMKQSGSLPPGATIWWRWRITDDQGRDTLTTPKEIIWLDSTYDWQTISGGNINLHWYTGGQGFARTLHDSAVKSLADLAQTTGLANDQPINLYIYGNFDDLRNAVLYEPGWTGGLAYSENNIVIIGIEPTQLDWGKRTEAHELTHVLAGRLTFSCLSDIPTWLQEGLAVYGEGGLDKSSQDLFDQAVTDNTLLSVRALSGGFSEDPSKADVSYSESYSIVKFLVEQYQQDKMLEFLQVLRDGATVDEALQKVYRFDVDGLEDAWRASIHAKPRPEAGLKPTPTVEPTLVPTFVPVSIERPPVTSVPAPTATSAAVAQNAAVAPTAPAASEPAATASAAANNTGVIAGIVVAVIVLGAIGLVVMNRRKQRTGA